MCFPGCSGHATNSSVQRASVSTSVGATKPRASNQPRSQYSAICSAVSTGLGNLDGSPYSRLVMSSMRHLLQPRQNIIPGARHIKLEVDLGPRQVADVLVAEAVRMRED